MKIRKYFKEIMAVVMVLTLTACSTTENIGNFINSGCGPKSVTKTRSASENWPKDWPEAVLRLTKVGNDLQCEARNIMVGCGMDVSVDWNLTARRRFEQKPQALVKQKGEQSKKLQNRNAQRAKQLGKEYLKGKGVNL